MTIKRRYKRVKLRFSAGMYEVTIPKWIVEEVLKRKIGDSVEFEVDENKNVQLKLEAMEVLS